MDGYKVSKELIIFDMINSKKFLRVNYGSTVHGKEELKAVIKVINNSTQMGKNVYLFEPVEIDIQLAIIFQRHRLLVLFPLKPVAR